MSTADNTPRPTPYTDAKQLMSPIRRLKLTPVKHAMRLTLSSDFEVLEIGSGPGYYSAEIASILPDGWLTLVDIQQEMLDLAKQNLEAKRATNVDYVKADAQSLPFDDESFDAVIIAAVIGEIPNKQKCIDEIYRVLKPNCRLYVTEHPGDKNSLSFAEVRSLFDGIFLFEQVHGARKNFTVIYTKQV